MFRSLLILSVIALTSSLRGEEQTLFDGKSLEGWTVTDCKTEIRDGALLLTSGNGLVRSNEKYADFKLSWECKNVSEKNYDSGVYFRFDTPFPKGRPWPSQYQVNLKQGQEGNVQGVKGAESKDLFKAGEWNSFKLTVKGDAAELEMNGKPAWKGTGLKTKDGYIGLQCETPGGGQFWFRNVKIEKLSAK